MLNQSNVQKEINQLKNKPAFKLCDELQRFIEGLEKVAGDSSDSAVNKCNRANQNAGSHYEQHLTKVNADICDVISDVSFIFPEQDYLEKTCRILKKEAGSSLENLKFDEFTSSSELHKLVCDALIPWITECSTQGFLQSMVLAEYALFFEDIMERAAKNNNMSNREYLDCYSKLSDEIIDFSSKLKLEKKLVLIVNNLNQANESTSEKLTVEYNEIEDKIDKLDDYKLWLMIIIVIIPALITGMFKESFIEGFIVGGGIAMFAYWLCLIPLKIKKFTLNKTLNKKFSLLPLSKRNEIVRQINAERRSNKRAEFLGDIRDLETQLAKTYNPAEVGRIKANIYIVKRNLSILDNR